METLEDLFEDGLRDIYYAEKAILKALPKMAKKAGHEDLKAAFNEHVQMTNAQVQRLEQVFEMIGVKPRAKKCPAMDGLVAEAEELHEGGRGRGCARRRHARLRSVGRALRDRPVRDAQGLGRSGWAWTRQSSSSTRRCRRRRRPTRS